MIIIKRNIGAHEYVQEKVTKHTLFLLNNLYVGSNVRNSVLSPSSKWDLFLKHHHLIFVTKIQKNIV